MKYVATFSDQSAALADAFGTTKLCMMATVAMMKAGNALTHLTASSVKALSREQRREYCALRKSGMYPIDALAQLEDRHS